MMLDLIYIEQLYSQDKNAGNTPVVVAEKSGQDQSKSIEIKVKWQNFLITLNDEEKKNVAPFARSYLASIEDKNYHSIYFDFGYQSSTFSTDTGLTNPSLFTKGIGFYRLSTIVKLLDTNSGTPTNSLQIIGNGLLSIQGENITANANPSLKQSDLQLIQAFLITGGIDIRLPATKTNFRFYFPLRGSFMAASPTRLLHRFDVGLVGIANSDVGSFWYNTTLDLGYRQGDFLLRTNSNYFYLNASIKFNLANVDITPFFMADLSVNLGSNLAKSSYSTISSQTFGDVYDLSIYIGIRKDASFLADLISKSK